MKPDRAGKFRPGDSRAPEVGSIWMSTNRRHFGQTMRVVRVSGHNVKVEMVGPGPRSHRKQVYVIRREVFEAKHVRVR